MVIDLAIATKTQRHQDETGENKKIQVSSDRDSAKGGSKKVFFE